MPFSERIRKSTFREGPCLKMVGGRNQTRLYTSTSSRPTSGTCLLLSLSYASSFSLYLWAFRTPNSVEWFVCSKS